MYKKPITMHDLKTELMEGRCFTLLPSVSNTLCIFKIACHCLELLTCKCPFSLCFHVYTCIIQRQRTYWN